MANKNTVTSSLGESSETVSERQLTIDDAISYVDDVKEHTAGDPDLLHDFLVIMKDIKKQSYVVKHGCYLFQLTILFWQNHYP